MIGSPHFQSYTLNLCRIALNELLDDIQAQRRRQSVQASLIVNPLTNIPYEYSEDDSDDEAPIARVATG